jgi:hypothetical protein
MPAVKTIITVREYARQQVKTELELMSFQVSDQNLLPPDVHRVLEQRARSAQTELANTVIGEEVAVRVSDGLNFLLSVLASFKEPINERILCRLSSYNLKEQLRMAAQVMKSGHIAGTATVLEAVRRFYESPEHPWHIGWADLLEALICGDYSFMYTPESRVVNLFDAGSPGFTGTLSYYCVLQVLRGHGADIDRSEVISLLSSLGHPASVTAKSIRNLLDQGLLWSEQGLVVPEGQPQQLKLSIKGEFYLDELMTKTMYLQHMGLVTPLNPELKRELSWWKPEDFKSRIRAARVMVKQLDHDEKSQWTEAERLGGDSVRVRKKYLPGRLCARIRQEAHSELCVIRDSHPEEIRMTPNDWNEVLGWFV